ncbi:hypothetical protein PVK06_035960 [Gossypium arboreum]|uniref:5-formyltetrahydrofolate cyclo-ligase n=1 Tax=Gossypium arboreum TaxID=29729 RepID=A0ABR0NKC7_GOSAR|nr:hypothetical protein PVK06_035960 [Gossypium arboreum]
MSNNDQEADNLESVFKQKRIIRSNVRQTLKSMDPSLRSQEDDIIQSIVLEAPWFKSSKRLCAYISCSALREVDTSKLLSQILSPAPDGSKLQTAKKLYVPRVEDKNSNMRMFNISRIDDLVANSMNILEPASVDADGNTREDVMHANDPVDLFILPGLAFDRSGRRLGRGGGYYDTFLKNYKELAKEKNWRLPLFVALSYSVQIMDEEVIPVTPNDVLVDALVSPTGVIPITSAALGRNSFSLTISKFFWLLPLPSHSADPDPLQDFCVANLSASISVNGFPCKPASEVTSDDFFFDGFTQEGLNTLGISMNRVDFAPGGINPPHSHPRASEVGVVIEGKLLVGFVTTNNVYYSKVLTAGHMFAIPRGLVHFQLNIGDGKALAYTAFNSHLPGAAIVPLNLFASSIPNEVLTKTFQVDADLINTIKSKFRS